MTAPISHRTQMLAVDWLTDWTVREIEMLFTGYELGPPVESLDETRWPVGSSVRRHLAARYHAAVDTTIPSQRIRLLRVYNEMLATEDRPAPSGFLAALRADGVQVADNRQISADQLDPEFGTADVASESGSQSGSVILTAPAPIDFGSFDPTDFEEFCFELVSSLDGFHNVDWRKGTPKATSPADGGRDIVAQVERTDVDQSKHVETWFIDCKHYDRGVPPDALAGLLTWAQAERPHVALVMASGFLSNPAKDFLRTYEANNRPPFRIKYWERPVLDKLTRGNRELLERYLVAGMRSQSEIIAAQEEFFDRIWYERHQVHLARHESGESPMPDDILRAAVEAAERIRTRRQDLELAADDFEWGMWNGKLSALRWVLGDDWDFLDT